MPHESFAADHAAFNSGENILAAGTTISSKRLTLTAVFNNLIAISFDSKQGDEEVATKAPHNKGRCTTRNSGNSWQIKYVHISLKPENRAVIKLTRTSRLRKAPR